MDTINPQILPSTLTRKEHHRSAIVGVWILVVTLLIAAIYVVQVISTKEPTGSAAKTDPNAKYLEALRTPTPPVTDADRSTALQKLSAPTPPVTDAERAAALKQLQ
jgi:hypothetical protein